MRILILLILLCCQSVVAQPFKYPATPKKEWTDQYPGEIRIQDPYHWLEDDHSEETKQWVTEQNQFTRSYLDSIPGIDNLRARMIKNWNYSRYETPFHVGESYMYYRTDGNQNQPTLFYIRSLKFVPLSIFDANKLSEDGTTAITQTVPSHDGKHLAFMVSQKGSDWNEIRIKETKTMKTLPEVIRWVKYSTVAWYGNGFFYTRYEAPLEGKELTMRSTHSKLFYHQLNSGQQSDSLVFFDNQNPKRTYRSYVTEDENFLVIAGSESTSGNAVLIQDLRKKGSKPLTLVPGFSHQYILLGTQGNSLLFLTDKDASGKKVVKADPVTLKFTDVVPEKSDMILISAEICGNYIVCNYLKNAVSKLLIYSIDGVQKAEIPLPGPGTVETINGSAKDSILFFNFVNFTSPSVIYRFNVNSMRMNEQFKSKLPFEPSEYVTEQVYYLSKDKTRIPMFLVYKKDFKKDGNTPVLLYGYGGFNISKTPEFKPERMAFLESGGMIALPNLRGGGEFGTAWHEAGIREKKQNVFDDCIAAAEWLISEGYTKPSKLAVQGRSNGGLLAGAVMTQRPDLFQVALPAVGVMDMLRYHKFTIGWAWAKDYGTSDDSLAFNYLFKYSPYHNLKAGTSYPATFITTADHDDRVVPAHSFKFAARLQEVQTGKNPTLIRIDTGAGHGAGKPTSKQIEEQTDLFAFLFYNLGMKL